MNRKLSYNGKELKEMTRSELENQVVTNKKRIVGNNIFLVAVAVASLFVTPPLSLVPIGIGVLRTYWLCEDNNAIKDEISRR